MSLTINVSIGLPGSDHERGVSVQIPSGSRDLFEWWVFQAVSDAVATFPKAEEYGGTGPAVDLQLIGENLASLLDMHDAPDAVKLELGCWFYLQGKVARLVTNYKHGDPGKPDTWFDANIYTMMARRIQETGQWP